MKLLFLILIFLLGAHANLYKRAMMQRYGRNYVKPNFYETMAFKPKSKIECGAVCNMLHNVNFEQNCTGFSYDPVQFSLDRPCKLFEIWSLDNALNNDVDWSNSFDVYYRPDIAPSKN